MEFSIKQLEKRVNLMENLTQRYGQDKEFDLKLELAKTQLYAAKNMMNNLSVVSAYKKEFGAYGSSLMVISDACCNMLCPCGPRKPHSVVVVESLTQELDDLLHLRSIQDNVDESEEEQLNNSLMVNNTILKYVEEVTTYNSDTNCDITAAVDLAVEIVDHAEHSENKEIVVIMNELTSVGRSPFIACPLMSYSYDKKKPFIGVYQNYERLRFLKRVETSYFNEDKPLFDLLCPGCDSRLPIYGRAKSVKRLCCDGGGINCKVILCRRTNHDVNYLLMWKETCFLYDIVRRLHDSGGLKEYKLYGENSLLQYLPIYLHNGPSN